MVTIKGAMAEQLKLKRLTGKNSAQHVFNSLLWKIAAAGGGIISISGEELKKIPENAKLKGDWDPVNQRMVITSVLDTDNIIAPGEGIVQTNGP